MGSGTVTPLLNSQAMPVRLGSLLWEPLSLHSGKWAGEVMHPLFSALRTFHCVAMVLCMAAAATARDIHGLGRPKLPPFLLTSVKKAGTPMRRYWCGRQALTNYSVQFEKQQESKISIRQACVSPPVSVAVGYGGPWLCKVGGICPQHVYTGCRQVVCNGVSQLISVFGAC